MKRLLSKLALPAIILVLLVSVQWVAVRSTPYETWDAMRVLHVLLWWGVVVLGSTVLRRIRPPSWGSQAVLLLFALHPALAYALGKPSARPYLLAALCLLLATRELLRLTLDESPSRLRATLGILVPYTLAVVSQPACLLWLAWAALWIGVHCPVARWGRHLPVLLASVPSMVLGALLYPPVLDSFTVARLTGHSDVAVPALGRGALHLLAPWWMFIPPTDPINSWGLPLGAGLVVLALLLAPWDEVLVWLGFFVLLAVPAHLRFEGTFFHDTHLLIPSFGLAAIVTAAVDRTGSRLSDEWRLICLAAAAGVLIVYCNLGATMYEVIWAAKMPT